VAAMRALFGPRWRMLMIGAGQLSRALAQMALALDFEVICCDPREEYHLTWDVPGTTFTKEMPDDAVLRLQLDAHSAVVASRTTPSSTTWCCWRR
jgi:xanthine dehydrogenase accessory factor